MNLQDLFAPFPPEAVHWRAQTLTRDGRKAMALAYLDARDVMDRLDEVCGPENWQSRYTETAKGRVLCEIGIRVGDEWVWKSDGAGDTAVEGEKGGISDSLKRAAVQWGIGRYLYRLDAPWVPCETYQNAQGKAVFKKWADDPWKYVTAIATPMQVRAAVTAIENAEDLSALHNAWMETPKVVKAVPDVQQAKDQRKADLTPKEAAE